MSDEQFMRAALAEAQKAFEADEIPIGAVVVMQGRIIARGHNQVERLQDPTAHAEMIALTSAFHYMGAKYLPEATLYVTVEPCIMCAGAALWSKIGAIVWGASDEKNGHQRYTQLPPFHPKTILRNGILESDCAQLMKDFFAAKRR